MHELTTKLLNDLLAASLGQPLVDVVYWSYPEQITHELVRNGVGSIIGEVQLVLPSGASLYLSWDETAGSFSLAISGDPLYKAGALSPFPALAAPEWEAFVGRPLLAAEVLGVASIPHALVLHFESGGVMIADGHYSEVGDGDHVLIHMLPEPQLHSFTGVSWRAPAV